MRSNIYIIGLAAFIAMTRCTGQSDKNISNAENKPINVETAQKENIKLKGVSDTLNFTSYDSTIAKFIYNNVDKYEPESFKEEYQELDKNYEALTFLIESLFKPDPDLKPKLAKIEEIRTNFIGYTRNKVINDYHQYNALLGMDFGFLISRNDSLVKPLIIELMNNDKSPLSEKEYCARVLLKKYNDSTYIDLIKKED